MTVVGDSLSQRTVVQTQRHEPHWSRTDQHSQRTTTAESNTDWLAPKRKPASAGKSLPDRPNCDELSAKAASISQAVGGGPRGTVHNGSRLSPELGSARRPTAELLAGTSAEYNPGTGVQWIEGLSFSTVVCFKCTFPLSWTIDPKLVQLLVQTGNERTANFQSIETSDNNNSPRIVRDSLIGVLSLNVDRSY